ncbi:MAG: branched-chain amino acid ABC transporter permease [Candidatus Rokuibacteriota bacterium]
MVASELAQYVVTGLLVGGVYALMSIGLALIFGIMRVVNFAQGDFMMLGMCLTFYYTVALGIDPLLGALLSIPPFFVVGLLVHRAFLVRVTGGGDPNREMDAQLILTLGLSLVITNVRRIITAISSTPSAERPASGSSSSTSRGEVARQRASSISRSSSVVRPAGRASACPPRLIRPSEASRPREARRPAGGAGPRPPAGRGRAGRGHPQPGRD